MLFARHQLRSPSGGRSVRIRLAAAAGVLAVIAATFGSALPSGTAVAQAQDGPVGYTPHASVVTRVGEPVQLPSTVVTVDADFRQSQQAVDWETVDPALFATPGRHKVSGSLRSTHAPVSGEIAVFSQDTQTKIAAVGDSITAGVGTTNPVVNSYPAQLQSMLGSSYNVDNFGVSGYTVLSKGDAPYRRHAYFDQSKAFKPDVVLFQLGTNDSKAHNWRYASDFVSDYRALVREYKSLPSKPVVYVMLPPAVRGSGAFGITESGVNLVMSKILEAVSTEEFDDVTIIDNNTPSREVLRYLPDTVHPDNDGAMFLANNIRRNVAGDVAKPHNRKTSVAELSNVAGMHLTKSRDTSGYQRLVSINAGDWVAFSGVDMGRNKARLVNLRTATGYSDVSVEVHIDAPDGPLIGTQLVTRTGGLDGWDVTQVATQPVSGVHDVFLSFSRPGAVASQELASLTWVNFAPNDKAAFPGFGLGWNTVRSAEQDIVPLAAGGLGIRSTQGELRGNYNNARNVVVKDGGSADFTATVRLDSQPNGLNAVAGLIVYLDDNNYFGAARKNYGSSQIGGINEVNGGYAEWMVADPTKEGPVYLRVTRKGNVMSAEYSPNGESWKVLRNGVQNASFSRLTELKVGIYAPRGVGAGVDTVMEFGQLTVNGSVVPYFDDASGKPTL